MNQCETDNIYVDFGYDDRNDYLLSLAKDFGVDAESVFKSASLLGSEEDFDGLLTSIEDGMTQDKVVFASDLESGNVIKLAGQHIEFVKYVDVGPNSVYVRLIGSSRSFNVNEKIQLA